MSRRRAGLSIVELLVVLAIIAVLLAFLLPAVQRARSSVTRMACANNLKQVGIAVQNYQATFVQAPRAWISSNRFGWSAFILPQLDQTNLFQQLDFNRPWMVNTDAPQLTALAVLRCPADLGSPIVNSLNLPDIKAARSNFAICGFDDMLNSNVNEQELGDYIAKLNSPGRKSSSALIGERRTAGSLGQAGGDTLWVGITEESTTQGRAYVSGSVSAANPPNRGTSAGFSSNHLGGLQFLFQDGAVRFVSDNIDTLVYQGFVATGYTEP